MHHFSTCLILIFFFVAYSPLAFPANNTFSLPGMPFNYGTSADHGPYSADQDTINPGLRQPRLPIDQHPFFSIRFY